MGTDRIDAGAKPSHVFTIFIRATADRIWDAITRSEFTTRYYYASTVDSDWRPGSSVVYAIEGQPMILGEVIESEPPRKLVTTFDARWGEDVAGDPPTRISWEIADAGPGVCQLTVVHDGFDGQTATYREIGGGMPLILSGLKTLLETGQPMMTAGEPEHANA